MPSTLTFSRPNAPLPSNIGYPFGVFLDADDDDWKDDNFLSQTCLDLLKNGCRWFTCFGLRAEMIHDRIDDIIIENSYSGVVTTYHSNEPQESAADFFRHVALMEMKAGLILVRNKHKWLHHF